MAKSKEKPETNLEKNGETETAETVPVAPELCTSRQEVADELQMSIHTFEGLVRKYPFNVTGVAGKINGRWRVAKDDVWRWFDYVQRQEIRHPESRRMRPQEAPELSAIKGRG